MSQFARKPSRADRVIAIVLASILVVVLGGATILFALLGNLIIPVVFGLAFLGSVVLLYRAAFTPPKALSAKQQRVVAWTFVVCGGLILVVAFGANESNAIRLSMVLSGLLAIIYGLAAILPRRDDA